MSPLLAVAVLSGLDVLDADGAPLLRGRRVGLVAHRASVSLGGRGAHDVLRSKGALVVRVFAPEHGLSGDRPAGASVADAKGAAGVDVVSLYGARTKPAPEQLRDLEALVFDLQDAGVRFYSYASTLLLCLEAAAEADLEVVVLDRPNPLGGDDIEGPLADNSVPRSMLSMAPGPLVHGLTLGELARFSVLASPRSARLTVVPMRGWRREMRWTDTGRPWPVPSPNLRSAEAALAYSGTALFEATNVSEGRGTEEPFLSIGAPWLDPAPMASVGGAFGFVSVLRTFVPSASSAAPAPKYEGVACAGIRVAASAARPLRPYAFGLALLQAARRQRGFEWLREGVALDHLLGTRRVRERIERGQSLEAMLAADAPGIESFRLERTPALLY